MYKFFIILMLYIGRFLFFGRVLLGWLVVLILDRFLIIVKLVYCVLKGFGFFYVGYFWGWFFLYFLVIGVMYVRYWGIILSIICVIVERLLKSNWFSLFVVFRFIFEFWFICVVLFIVLLYIFVFYYLSLFVVCVLKVFLLVWLLFMLLGVFGWLNFLLECWFFIV